MGHSGTPPWRIPAVPHREHGEPARRRMTLMPDENADAYVWNDEQGALRDDELLTYGVSTALIARLRAWLDASSPTVGAAADPEAEVGVPWSLAGGEQETTSRPPP